MGKANVKAKTLKEEEMWDKKTNAQENFILPSLSFNISTEKKPTPRWIACKGNKIQNQTKLKHL